MPGVAVALPSGDTVGPNSPDAVTPPAGMVAADDPVGDDVDVVGVTGWGVGPAVLVPFPGVVDDEADVALDSAVVAVNGD